ncbi:MAG: hypothetical protein MI810_15965, partial [Flavobacteriales bacterium]|nr:hypothetical protein [Flavobacteriales bacterium]
GLRYFDWRLYWDTDLNGFYIQHGLRGAQLSDMLSEVVAFLNANSGASELIVIEVSHLNISSNSQQATDLVNAFKQTLPSGSIYAPPSNAGDPFLDLSSTKVSDITGGSNKVILLNTDSNIRYDDSVFFNASGYAPAPNTIDGTNQVDTLKSAATTALNSLASGKLARLSWSLTCQAEDAVNDAVGILSQQPGFEPALKKIATEANMALPSFLDSLTAEQEAKINCITVDWHDQAPANESVVDLAIEICNHRTTT